MPYQKYFCNKYYSFYLCVYVPQHKLKQLSINHDIERLIQILNKIRKELILNNTECQVDQICETERTIAKFNTALQLLNMLGLSYSVKLREEKPRGGLDFEELFDLIEQKIEELRQD